MKLITRMGNPAYHRGFKDAKDGRPYSPSRLFKGAYRFGYDYARAWSCTPWVKMLDMTPEERDAEIAAARLRQQAWKARYV